MPDYDFNNMSDEEFMNVPLDIFEKEGEAKAEAPEEDVEPEDAPEEEQVEEEVLAPETDETDEEVETQEPLLEVDPELDPESTEAPSEDDESEAEKVPAEVTDTLAELLKTPLKHGGGEITINSGEELVTLAQRGLGSAKRMQELAPKLKMIRTLEAGGMTQEDLNFAIALHKKDPEAIRKLISTSGVDPFDVSTGNADVEYVAPDHSISDAQHNLEEVLVSLGDEKGYSAAMKTLTAFSDSSKLEVSNDPSSIATLVRDHSNGNYEQAMEIVRIEQAKGNLLEMSEFAAYRHVMKVSGEQNVRMAGKSEASHNGTSDGQTTEENLAANGGSPAGHKGSSDRQVVQRQTKARNASNATNRGRGSSQPAMIDFDSMSDEDIADIDVNDVFK